MRITFWLHIILQRIWILDQKVKILTKILTSPEIFGYDTRQVKFHLKFWRNKPWLRKTSNPNKPHPYNGKSIPPPQRAVQGWHPWCCRAHLLYRSGCLLQATTRSNPFDSSTHLKKCQKSFSACQGARLASMNWLTILVSSGLSDTWHGVWTRRDLAFLGWVFWG